MKKIFLIAICGLSNAAIAQTSVTLPENVGLPGGTLFTVMENFVKWLLGIFGFIAIIGFIISGFMYLTAAGDEDQQEKAKKQMTWSIIGVIIGLSGYVIIKAVDAWLNNNSTF